jgi:hypothetical protein
MSCSFGGWGIKPDTAPWKLCMNHCGSTISCFFFINTVDSPLENILASSSKASIEEKNLRYWFEVLKEQIQSSEQVTW